MRLRLDLDTDPAGAGRRARWWAVVLGFLAVLGIEITFLATVAVLLIARL